ncbi:hypothetical protein [Neobacillus terrae]|uniref:hypothetical protein n=1 Tax=Neobacillus terrae TaxID=3034837 RepID=UPI00140ACA19|nr:hypothetical protein [Neobacillus terrae]NHM30028.1 hypothetical protein [Neobacillus terrae]
MTNKLSYAKSQKVIADLAAIVYKYHKQKSTAQYIAAKSDQDLIQLVGGKTVKVGRIVKGENFKISTDKGVWYEMDFGGNKALVSKRGIDSYNRPVGGSFFKGRVSERGQIIVHPITPVYSDASSKRPIASITVSKTLVFDSIAGNYYKVSFGDRFAYIEKSKADLQFTPSIKYFQINKENTPVISKSTGLQIAVIAKGATFIRLKESASYQEIQHGNSTAYVPKANVLPVYDANVTNPAGYTIAANLINLSEDTKVYLQMDAAAGAIATLLKGQKINYIQRNGNWYSINLAGRTVYLLQAEKVQ